MSKKDRRQKAVAHMRLHRRPLLLLLLNDLLARRKLVVIIEDKCS